MPLIDADYLIAFLNPRDQLHARAHAWAAHIVRELVVTEYVIWETVNFFSKPVNRPKVHALVAHVSSAAGYEVVSRPRSFKRVWPFTPSGPTRNGR